MRDWEANVYYAWDDMTFVLDSCVIVRQPIANNLVWRFENMAIHTCPRHAYVWIMWPKQLWRVNEPTPSRVFLTGMFDRTETEGLIP